MQKFQTTKIEIVKLLEDDVKLITNATINRNDPREFNVQLKITSDEINRNNWEYLDIEKYAKTFISQPILCAFVNYQVADGHNSSENPKTGDTSWIGANDERVVGAIWDKEDSVWTEKDSNGITWIYANGRIFAFYYKELVEELKNKREMKVSSETDVNSEKEVGNIIQFLVWQGLGVTILNDNVQPSFPDARIMVNSVTIDNASEIEKAYYESKMSKSQEQNALTGGAENTTDMPVSDINAVTEEIQTAELNENNNQITKKESNKNMKLMGRIEYERIIADTQKQFETFKPNEYSVIARDENVSIVLNKATGQHFSYTHNAEDDEVGMRDKYIEGASGEVVFTTASDKKIKKDLDDHTAMLISEIQNEKLKTASVEKELETAKVTIENQKQMVENAEKEKLKRRRQDVVNAVTNAHKEAQSDIANANLNYFGVSETEFNGIIATVTSGKYDNSVDDKGVWNGIEVAVDKYNSILGLNNRKATKKMAEKSENFVYGMTGFQTATDTDAEFLSQTVSGLN